MLEPYPKIKSICRGSELQYTRTPRCGWKVSVLKTNPHRKISGCLHARYAETKIMGEQKTKVKKSRRMPRTGYRGPDRKNKCGPGQPPGPHCFRNSFCDPCPRTRHGGSSS